MDLIQSFRTGLKPVRKITCDLWADQNVILTSEATKESGPWRTERVPFMREILQKLSPTDPAQKVIFAKGVQIAATTSGIIAMLTYADTDPSPIMYVLPTIAMAEDFSKDKLQPLITGCESLNAKFKDPRARDSGNTILGKRYPGGYISLAGANSAASLRSKSIRLLVMDEVDAYPRNLEKEGSPVGLATKRTATYGNKKKVYIPSTPTVQNASVIWSEFEATDQRHFHLPCPECGVPQNLVFEQFKWIDGRPDTVKYECLHCNYPIPERAKVKMLPAGEWISHVPERRNPYTMGYHLSSLYSPYGWLSWPDIVAEYEAAVLEMSKDQEDNKMRTFVNTVEGLTYATSGERPDWQRLYDRRENYGRNVVNNSILLITIGIDVQKDRVELEIVGWGLGRRSWSINYHVIEGEISDQRVQDIIVGISQTKWTRPDKVELPVHKICMDSNYNTTDVYQFCNANNSDFFIPIHGSPTQPFIFSTPKHINKTVNGTQFSTRFYNLGVDVLKDELYTCLKKTLDVDNPDGPAGYCHFPEYDQNFFEGITAEMKVTHFVDGHPRFKWEKKYQRNEPLDCRNYARAALALSGYDEYGDDGLRKIFENYRQISIEAPKPKKRQADFWKR